MTPEVKNYLVRCRDPSFAFFATIAFLDRLSKSFFLRVWPEGRPRGLPRKIARLRRDVLRQATSVPQIEPWQELPACSLSLAIGSIEVKDEPNWLERFEDIELEVSLHRWNWLFGAPSSRAALNRAQGLNLMRSWLRQCGSNDVFRCDAYTIGERIANGASFLLLTGDGSIPNDLACAFRSMGIEVARYLEYRGHELTGNHAFNNARALLFAGLAGGLAGASELALAIAAERLPVIVTGDGFLREGSSHYHFLFTRWVLEMRWIAERGGHHAFTQTLEPYAKLLVQRCWFFLVQDQQDGGWQFPLFGDISPDFRPDWLVSLPWSRLAVCSFRPAVLPQRPTQHGWGAAFGLIDGSGIEQRSEIAAFPGSGWLRVDHQPWTLFLRAESTDGSLRAGHAHSDLTSFVLFRKGRVILIDTGRADYTRSARSLYGITAAAHNALLVDGLGAAADGPTWLQRRYRAIECKFEVSHHQHGTDITVCHNGFERLRGFAVLHRRRLRLSDHRFEIEDHLDGKGDRKAVARFHFAPGLEIREARGQGWTVGNSGLKFIPDVAFRQLSGDLSQADGQDHSCFSAYGVRQDCWTVELACEAQLPFKALHVLTEES